MKFYCLSVAVLLCHLALNSIADGADIEMYVTTSAMVQVPRDISNTYGIKFCVRAQTGIVMNLAPTYGSFDISHRFSFEVGTTYPNNSLIRPQPTTSVGARNYEPALVNFDHERCFWALWPDCWYFVGKGSVWGEQPLMNYRNVTQSKFAGLWVNTNLNSQAYLKIIDENISKEQAQAMGALCSSNVSRSEENNRS